MVTYVFFSPNALKRPSNIACLHSLGKLQVGRQRMLHLTKSVTMTIPLSEAPASSEFLSLLRISEFFGFQWQKLAEILSLFKLYNNLGKVAVRVKLWLIIYCGHLVEWIVK